MRLRQYIPNLDGATQWLNSGMIQKEDLIGKPTLIHFWSVSCELCKVALPQINELRDDNANQLNVVAVHMPRSYKDEDVEGVKQIAKEYNITEPIYVDNNHVLTELFSVRYVPAYFVFDAGGRLRYLQSGSNSMRLLSKRLNRIISLDD